MHIEHYLILSGSVVHICFTVLAMCALVSFTVNRLWRTLNNVHGYVQLTRAVKAYAKNETCGGAL